MAKDENDEASRRDEINAFAAMAAGGLEGTSEASSPSNPSGDAAAIVAESIHPANTGTFDFAAAIQASNNDYDTGDPFLTQLRQSSGDDAFTTRNEIAAAGEGNGNIIKTEQKLADEEELALRKSFAQAGQKIDNSGTFSRLTPMSSGSLRSTSVSSLSSSRHRNQNLEAAALALADDDSPVGVGSDSGASPQLGGVSKGASPSNVPPLSVKKEFGTSGFDHPSDYMDVLQFPCGAAVGEAATKVADGEAAASSGMVHPHFGQIPPNKTPMHAQEVRLQRPLFFGPYLPPRVIEEARRIVDEALQEQWKKHEEAVSKQEQEQQGRDESEDNSNTNSVNKIKKEFTPRLGQFPSGVRNLVSAIQCYGFGLDILPREMNHRRGAGVSDAPSPYISVFCPRWSEDRKKSHTTTPSSATALDDSVTSSAAATAIDGDEKSPKRNGTLKTQDTSTTIASFSGQPQRQPEKETRENDSLSFSMETTGVSDRDLFSAIARHGSEYSGFSNNENSTNAEEDNSEGSDDSRIIVPSSKRSGDSTPPLPPKINSDDSWIIGKASKQPVTGSPPKIPRRVVRSDSVSDPETKMIRSSGMESDYDAEGKPKVTTTPSQSDRAQFTQWIQIQVGESPANENNNNNSKSLRGTFNFNDSFRGMNTLVSNGDDSDDDTVVGSEMKTKVGVNEHLNAALASLEVGQSPAEAIESDANAEEDGGELTQVPLTEDGGRPLSNQELMNAHAPLFGIDDPPLPSESDLGNHETREELQRSKEQRRVQAFIEKFCPHNIFGPLACPNPATSPDDNHSWNSLSTPLQRNPSMAISTTADNGAGSTTTSPMGRSISSDDLASLHSANGRGMTAKKVSQLSSTPKGYDPRTRYGWWNTPNNEDDADPNAKSTVNDNVVCVEPSSLEDAPIQLPPVEHPANGYPIQTQLEPSPETLRMQNRPLSELHPATSLAQALPFISDRPPSYRYLQVNTQAVAFPALAEEVEPLFCSLAIYHVETIAHSLGDRGMAPIPDLERCGKVTETLNFDLIKNPDVERGCFASISPYMTDQMNPRASHLTSCGVFPLPSNLSVSNLYAIITVGKVISEGSDFEPYLRAKPKGKEEEVNIESLRAKAEKASTNHGNFIMPFAFGVAPLLQVFGADVPRVPSSRAVQIPLFRFYAGNGERQIIDHIMVMLYPRADHRASGIGGPAPLTNGGTAMLVMRNFGYLGLHEVVNGKSSLAMDRLIDFTGEMQLRRRDDDENDTEALALRAIGRDAVPAWRSQYKAEPTINGGRCTQTDNLSAERSFSSLNAQELGPVPLLLSTPLGRPSGTPLSVPKSRTRGDSSTSGEDMEPYFHTTFCNELLCYPRQLRNCQKGNIVVKVEMRDVEWNPEYGVYLAHMPAFGPVVHNLRRGPFLVQGAYTSCSARRSDPHFLDEFKVKLPLLLRKNESRCASIFFTVYRLSFSSRKKWGLRGLGKKRTTKKFDEITGDVVGESDGVNGKDCQLIQLGCGFLPLEKKHSLLENGCHDVKISYVAKYPLPEFCDREGIKSDTLIMSDFTMGKGDHSVAGDESFMEDGDSQGSERYFVDTLSATSASDRDTVLSENMDSSISKQLMKQVGMLLQVRISVNSSIHSQNATLNEFLSQEPDVSIPLKSGGDEMMSFLRSGKDEIFRQLNAPPFRKIPEDVQYDTKKLLISTIDLAKPDMCSVSDVSLHLVRVCKQLWKIAVVGTGNHDLKWANPAATLPLRVNAFATLLQILGSSTLFLSKRGVTQLDGNGKFNLLSLSRVIGLLFDEKEMFGDSYSEAVSNELLTSLIRDESIRKSLTKRGSRGHIRSNFEFGHGSDGAGAIIHGNTPISGEPSSFSIQGTDASAFADSTKSSNMSPLSALELRDKLSHESKVPKMDTVNDFKNAMQTGNLEKEYEDAIHEGQFSSGNDVAQSWIIAFGGNRRWMTAPAPGLSTIQEDTGDDEDHKSSNRKATKGKPGPLDSLDAEIVLSKDSVSNPNKKPPVKQFRVPKRSPKLNTNDERDNVENSKGSAVDSVKSLGLNSGVTLLSIDAPGRKGSEKERRKQQSHTLPTTDADMLKAGTSFLDAIEKSLGLGTSFSSNYPQEEDMVFGKHHRKTVSHSSIDWSIPNDDLSRLQSRPKNDKRRRIQTENIKNMDESMTTLSDEIELSFKLPNFADRLASLGASEIQTGRWFPYTYEVIIMQWTVILTEQQRSTIDSNTRNRGALSEQKEAIIDAASRSTGTIIVCAPVLFEVIKQSIGARVTSFINQVKRKTKNVFPPLVTLDDVMLSNLEQLIAMITDLCLDSRNFDSYETRLSSVDVNDSIVCFLRDMFAFLDPACVYRLTMQYLSRLIARDATQTKDSKIGLDISHEIKKLQMSAISAFVRFPDFIKVNSPQMNSWTDSLALSPDISTVNFFDNVLEYFENLGLQSILSNSESEVTMELPKMTPHWMAETIVDVCFSGIEHKEPNIQLRSASLLLELFWSQGQRSLREGYSAIVASMYITFIEKALSRTSYLSCFPPKNQVRRDVVLCVVFVLQSAPLGLLRAVWRKLFRCSSGKGLLEKNGGISSLTGSIDESTGIETQPTNMESDGNEGPDIYDMFSLLNLCLATVEYEGSDEHTELDGMESDGPLGFWPKEFLMSRENDTVDSARRKRMLFMVATASDSNEDVYATTSSRKWFSHDASMVLIRTAQQIVRELRFVLEPMEGSQSLFNPARRKARANFASPKSKNSQVPITDNGLKFTYMDTIIFVRGATSVYLNSLVLRESDIAIVKTLNASVEIIKIFGIQIFNEAVGETLQHWLRMITFHCGSRRAEVRVPASDFAELILRSTWDCFGSFFRIRIPLLAVQTEVMQRIVATATERYYRDQRKAGVRIDLFSNACAEASLTPLWRTTDRLHHQSASQNVAFRSSLVRLAEKIKKLHKAYIAAHALSFQDRQEAQDGQYYNSSADSEISNEVEFLKRANRISVIRVVNASAGYSKQFLGFQIAGRENTTLAHHEALEDAFLDAADVFSPTELPDLRVAWLRKLAQFHANRSKNAEEATCHYMIYYTLNRSCRLNWSLWSSTPFLPWIDNLSDGVHLEVPSGDPDGMSLYDPPPLDYGRQVDRTSSVRRIFYRYENSVTLNDGDIKAGGRKAAFNGVALTSEYFSTTPWISVKEMEANMLEEAEAAGHLFQRSGIITSSRYMWGLAAQYYAQKFMYGKLTHVYGRLARTVVSQVPHIDNTLEQAVNVGIPLGRFYRVWFHGGAPDELIGAEYVYRTRTKMSLTKFGKELRGVLRSIIPDKTPIHLVLDGRPEEIAETNTPGFRMGGAPLEPVKVKVTPLRPVVRNESRIRGLPEWFKLYIDNVFCQRHSRRHLNENNILKGNSIAYSSGNNHSLLRHSRSYTSIHSSNTSFSGKGNEYSGNNHRHYQFDSEIEGELVGADKFWYTQSMNKDRSRGSRDWLKGASDDFAEKTIRVTQLQVRQAFPACVSRQTVIHRDVYNQSPLEAAVDNLCLWCAVLFRTLISSNGSLVLGVGNDPGIGIEAAKVVSECIHSSRVKEIGTVLLRKNTSVQRDDDDVLHSYDRLGENEVQKFQLKLARSLIVFMELLHLLIARNRDLLLDVVQKRKKYGPPAKNSSREVSQSSSMHRVSSRGDLSLSGNRTPSRTKQRRGSESSRRYSLVEATPSREDSSVKTRSSNEDYDPGTSGSSTKDTGSDRPRIDPTVRTESAIGIQRELQLAFINIAKELWPMIHGVMENDTPRWLKECCHDNYFSRYVYRHTKIPIGEELTFEDVNIHSDGPGPAKQPNAERLGSISSFNRSDKSYYSAPDSPGGSTGSSSNVSRGSDTGRSTKSLMSLRSKERGLIP